MHPRTSRRNGCRSDQRSFYQLQKDVGENGLQWRAIVRKEHLGGTKRLKKLFEQRKMRSRPLLQERSSSDLQSRYTEVRKAATSAVKKFKEKSWEEFGRRRLDSNYFFGRPSAVYMAKDRASRTPLRILQVKV